MGKSANIAAINISLFHIVGYVYFVIMYFALTALKRKSECLKRVMKTMN